jgi:transposase
MLGDISNVQSIYIICGHTDMRKSIDGLCAIVQNELKMNPFDTSLYLFCGKKRDRIKALLYEKDGFILFYKRLTGQGNYKWPRNQLEVRNLTWREFSWLLDGLEIDQPKAIKPPLIRG